MKKHVEKRGPKRPFVFAVGSTVFFVGGLFVILSFGKLYEKFSEWKKASDRQNSVTVQSQESLPAADSPSTTVTGRITATIAE
jgi:hypothetical protein